MFNFVQIRINADNMPLIKNLVLNNTFAKNLPMDTSLNNQSRQVLNFCASLVNPTPPKSPKLIHFSAELVNELGIEDPESNDFLELMSGVKNFPDFAPYALCYGGHQFGHWAGQLGDGRAINIAEVQTGESTTIFQLKGAGRTPYSRSADGLAVLRSSIREYLMSEAMFHLGVPTTRALSLCLSGNEVLRDVMYDGNAAYEKGAIVCRVAPSFIRFGSFEIFTARQDYSNLKALLDYTIQHSYPHLGEPSKATYLKFFQEVVDRSLTMVIHWQRVGFVHGVMNTDNLSILGLTIDYGPYGWLENYDPGWTPNTTDEQHKRYRFGNQPSVVLWNLSQLANALFPLIEDVPSLTDILDGYKINYQNAYLEMMCAKIGIYSPTSVDQALINNLTDLLRQSQLDMTLFFRNLNKFDLESPLAHLTILANDSYLSELEFAEHQAGWQTWLTNHSERLKREPENSAQRIEKMNKINPKYVLRNYMAHLAIEAADKNDYSVLMELYTLLKNPYSEQKEMEKWFVKRPAWAIKKIGCSALSCSS
jgi:uncharacterized protein YdiU (UPF0061 family)